MPSRKIHRLVDQILLGKDYEWLHKMIDYPSTLLGPYHRILFHNPAIDPIITAIITGDVDAGISHYLHIKTDEYFSKKKKRKDIDLMLKIIEAIL